MVAAAATVSAQAPPVAHAIGGSLGSAIALFMFYPLERARIELQSEASHLKKSPDLSLDEADGLEMKGSAQLGISPPTPTTEKNATSSSSPVSDSSWTSLPQKEVEGSNDSYDSFKDLERNASSSSNNLVGPVSSSTTLAQKRKQDSLLQCLVRLYERGELYKGVSPVVSTIFTSQFIFFYVHAVVKKLLLHPSQGRSKLSNAATLSLLSSCLAGLGNVLLTNPLWVVNMAIVTGETETRNLWKELYVMIQEKGLAHMWSGASASALLVSNPVIQFFCYEQMKAARLVSPTKSVLRPIEAFVIGAMAKGIATVST